MSKYVPKNPNTRNGRRDWINTIVMIHDLQCDCGKPLDHTLDEIYSQEPELKKQKCHGTENGQDIIAEDGFGPGDLEALFDADFGEDDTTEKDITG